MGADGASCSTTLSNRTRLIDDEDWSIERFGMACTTAETYAAWKAALLKLCKVSDRCIFEEPVEDSSSEGRDSAPPQ